MACAKTVEVVVPSPAISLVLVAASFRSWAPIFSYGSSSSISFATVTPSCVTVGAPNFLSSATLRPLGPRVVATALARASTPALSRRRASSPYTICFAIGDCSLEVIANACDYDELLLLLGGYFWGFDDGQQIAFLQN